MATVGRGHETTAEVQVVCISTDNADTPVVAVRALVVEQAIAVVPVATSRQKSKH